MRARRQVLQDDEIDAPIRPTRSTRQTLTRSNGTANAETDDDDDSDDDQLLSQIASQNRPKRSPRGPSSAPMTTEFVDTTSPVHNRNGHFLTRTREKIRRKQISRSTNSTTNTTVTSNSSSYQSTSTSTSTRSMTITETTSQVELRRIQVSLINSCVLQIEKLKFGFKFKFNSVVSLI